MKQKLLTIAQQRRRTRKQARARRTRPRRSAARQSRHRVALRLEAYRQQPVFEATVVAPSTLSFVEQPVAFLAFLAELRNVCYPRHKILISLESVTRLTNCALLLLQAKLQDGLHFTRGANMYVRPPENPEARRVWHKSFQAPRKVNAPIPIDQTFILGRRPHYHKQVEPELAETLIHRAMRYLSGQDAAQDHHGAYRILTECMANTFKHADPKSEAQKNWWLASYVYDGVGPRRWCFSFVDNGVGILKSLVIKGLIQNIKHQLGFSANQETLRLLMEGEVGSRLQLSFRGKGLPSILKELKRGNIENLVIITNDIHANFATQEYVTLPQPFGGTFLYWELSLPPQSPTS